MVKEIQEKAERNRTLTVDAEEIPTLRQHISSIGDIKENGIVDALVNGDLYDCIDFIPDNTFDLIIIDPPYNLDKDFNGNKFRSMKEDEYEEYLRSWFYKVCDKLKQNGSLYMCGDWKCTASMQRVIEEKEQFGAQSQQKQMRQTRSTEFIQYITVSRYKRNKPRHHSE